MNRVVKNALAITIMLMPLLACDPQAWAAGLPGGATSLNEAHADWTLHCGMQGTGDAAVVQCNVTQFQIDKATKRRVVTMVLNPQKGGGVKGIIMMPFGLNLDQGATFQLDTGAITAPAHFRTCVPAGCIVPIDWPVGTVQALRAATVLKVAAVGDNGKPVPFSISPNGLASAMDRASDLTGIK